MRPVNVEKSNYIYYNYRRINMFNPLDYLDYSKVKSFWTDYNLKVQKFWKDAFEDYKANFTK